MQTKLTVYHGSNYTFDTIDFSKSKDKRDFGRGFYTTTLKEQAEDWAQAFYDRYGGGWKYLYTYKLEMTDKLAIKHFDGISAEWLDMIKNNRTFGGIQHTFDIVRGPVTDDRTTRTIALYTAGIINADEAIERLKNNKVNDQISLHTQDALQCLELIKREEAL